MNINRENYTRSLENIKASERFLNETKKLMLEEAAKEKKPNRKPFIVKLTPFAAAAACLAIIAVVGLNTLKEKNLENVMTVNDSAYSEPAVNSQNAFEEESAEAAPVTELTEDENAEADIAEELPVEEAIENGGTDVQNDGAPAFFAVTETTGESVVSTESTSADESTETGDITFESVETNDIADDAAAEENEDFGDGSYDYAEDTNADNETAGSDSDDDVDNSEDIADTDDDDIDIEGEFSVAPAFSKVVGGDAVDYSEFSPSENEKLLEYISLISQDDINAEVTTSESGRCDIFGEKALALNNAFAEALEKLVPSSKESLIPIFSFSVFDNVSGDILYTVQTDGSIISVRIKNGETVYFEADKATVDAIISAAK
ncbi:MAG: hypothetical protein ACI4JK_10545 [Oscillospiraceae bacterium]